MPLTSSRCGTRLVPIRNGVAEQVRQYINEIRPGAAAELNLFRIQPTLRLAVEKAALAIGRGEQEDKRFSHQYRITSNALRQSRKILLRQMSQIRSCNSFDELHKLICRLVAKVHGLGELYCYDTALRIGAKLGLLPTKVYLHRGTRIGARAFGRRDYKAASIDPLPELRQLEPHEMEDFLCIFKDSLHRPKCWRS